MTIFRRTPQYLNWQRLKAAALIGLTPTLAMTGLPAQGQQLEEVLVTATRRAETDVQTTPVAVTPVTSQEIDRVIPRDLGDILIYAPNVIDGKQPGFKSANFAIRGVGQNGISCTSRTRWA